MIAKFALAGIIAPIWFTTLVVVQSLLQPDYSDVALPISALAAWPYGWIQKLNFFVFSALMLAYAVGLQRGVQPGRANWIGFAFLAVSGVGALVAGLFSCQRAAGDLIVPIGHRVGAVMSFMGAGVGLIAMSRAMAADPKWRSLAGYALACGVAIVLMFVLMGPLTLRDDAPLHAWTGLLQRIVLVAWFPCTIVLSIRLRRVARAGAMSHVSAPFVARK
jgi:hypothetical membrane protein